MVVHISRQQGQSLLYVRQQLRLKAGPDFLQRIDEPGHFVGPDPTIQRQPIEPSHFPPHPGKRVQRDRIAGGIGPRLLVGGSMTSDRSIGDESSITQFVLTGELSSGRRFDPLLDQVNEAEMSMKDALTTA